MPSARLYEKAEGGGSDAKVKVAEGGPRRGAKNGPDERAWPRSRPSRGPEGSHPGGDLAARDHRAARITDDKWDPRGDHLSDPADADGEPHLERLHDLAHEHAEGLERTAPM